MKKVISFILVITLLICITNLCYAEKEYIVTEDVSKIEDEKPEEKIIWDLVSKYSPNDIITAGIMGMFQRESGLKSNAIAGYHYDITRDRSAEFTELIDKGLSDSSTLDQFIDGTRRAGGYGLGQWYSIKYLEEFYKYACEWGTTIADVEMQCSFILYDIENNYEELWEILLTDTNIWDAAKHIAILYEGTACYEVVMDYAYKYYCRYHKYGEE